MSALSWKSGARRKLKNWYVWRPLDVWSNISWSQEGEDLLLSRIMGEKSKGFYIDVGAHHPERFSNTCLFYRRGWNGINIDANPDSIRLFNRRRPRDINVCATVHNNIASKDFVKWEDSALDGIENGLQLKRSGTLNEEPHSRIKTWPKLLSEILKENIPEETSVDFLSVDVEGEELAVLESNDWGNFYPRYILVEETAEHSYARKPRSVEQFLKALDYELSAATLNTRIYSSARFQES